MYILITYLILAFVNSLMIIGVYTACYFEWHPQADLMIKERYHDCDEHGILENSKMIGWRLRYNLVTTFGEFWSKPLITCPPCMSSVWGIPAYFAFTIPIYGLSITTVICVIPYALALCGTTKWIHNITA